MKKLLMVALMMCICVSICGCGTTESVPSPEIAISNAETPTSVDAEENAQLPKTEAARKESNNLEVSDKKAFPFTGKEFADEFSKRMAFMKATDNDGVFDVSIPSVDEFTLEPTHSKYWRYDSDEGSLKYSVAASTVEVDKFDSPVTNIIVTTAYNSGEDESFLKTLLIYSNLINSVDASLTSGEGAKIIGDLLKFESGVSEVGTINFPIVTKNGIKYSLLLSEESWTLFCSIDDTYSQNTTPNNTQEVESQTQEVKWYSEDTYKIGVDLPAGEYYLVPVSSSSKAYMAVCSDSNGNDILENDNFDGPAYITVEDGQYFEVVRAKFALASEIKTSFNSAELSDGMYLVGKDIPAGEYLLKANSGMKAYVCVYNNSTANRNIVTNDNFEGKKYVTVNDGEYLELVRCKGALL